MLQAQVVYPVNQCFIALTSYHFLQLLQSSMQKYASSNLAFAVDIWSLGCTIIEMLNGKPPWSEYEGVSKHRILSNHIFSPFVLFSSPPAQLCPLFLFKIFT